MNQVNLFLVGAGKAGTSSLAGMLSQHRNIYVPELKEPNYFCQYTQDELKNIDPGSSQHSMTGDIKSLSEYLDLYSNANNEFYLSDASTSYLHCEKAAANIYGYNRQAKIVMILRDPVDRAFSHYLMHRRSGLTYLSFEQALNKFYRNKTYSISNYIYIGMYYKQVKRYFDLFGRDNVLVVLYEDFVTDYRHTTNQIFDFLDIDRINVELQRDNAASLPKNRLYSLMLYASYSIKPIIPSVLRSKLKPIFFTDKKPKLDITTRKQLIQSYFFDDIEALEALLDVELLNWKTY